MYKKTINNKQQNVSLTYEKKGFLNNLFFTMIIHPLLNSLTVKHQKHVKKTHKLANDIVENRTSHLALEAVYTGSHERFSRNLFEKIVYKLWMNTDNAKGLRNRLKITENQIYSHVRYLIDIQEVKEINMLSIASGSARSFVDVLSKLKNEDIKINIVFLDKNPYALEYSKGLIIGADFKNKFTFEWVEDTANNYLNSKHKFKNFHIIEMVGLMDYFDDKKAVITIRSIYDRLYNYGCLITANVIPNAEKNFLSKVVDWDMVYRHPKDFIQLFLNAGFSENKLNHEVEPLKVHVIVKAIKR